MRGHAIRPTDAIADAIARLLWTHRRKVGLTQAEAALAAGQKLGKPEGLDKKTWLRAEKGRDRHGTSPEGGSAISIVNLLPDTLAAMALAVEVSPAELRRAGRPDAADLMDEWRRIDEDREDPGSRVHNMLDGLNRRAWLLDDAGVAQAEQLIARVEAYLDVLLEERRLMPRRGRLVA